MKDKFHGEPVMYTWPSNLTEADKKLIIKQCEIQGDTEKEDIEGFANAFADAKNIALDKETLDNLTPEFVEEFINRWAVHTHPPNKTGYRHVPVRFGIGEKALDPELIPQAMKGYAIKFAEGIEPSDELYREFEEIHPFKDGNGRVGDLLWKMDVTRKSGSWPEALPPDLFKKEVENITEKEQFEKEIQQFFDNPDLDLPDNNRDISSDRNIRWLFRNYAIRNGDMPEFIKNALKQILESRQKK